MSLRNTIGRGSNNIVEVRAPGLKGDAGTTWRGNWATSTSYAKNDLVRYIPNGNLYISLSVHTSSGTNEPTKDASQWNLFAQTGDAEGWANTIRHTLFVDSGGFTLVDQTPTPSAAWAVSSSYVEVSQTSSDGSGAGVKFAITTDASGNPYFTVTNPGLDSAGDDTYAAAEEIIVTDPGTAVAPPTATVTVESVAGDSGYSAKHGTLQANDWASNTDGFIPLDAKSEDSDGKPDIATSTGTITFAGAHGYSAGDEIVFRMLTNTSYPTTITAPTGLTMETKIYYVKSDGLTTTSPHQLRVSEDAGTNGSIRVITAQGTGTLIAGNEYSAKAWAVGGTEVTETISRGAAKEWAITTGGTVDTSEFSAKEYAQGTVATGGTAKEWAQDVSAAVDTTFSSKEYAHGSQVGTGGSSKNWATQFNADITGATSGDMSSKEWARGVLGRGESGEGSAKDWATYAGGSVDDAGHSAMAWAVGGTGVTTTAGNGSALDWAKKIDGAVTTSGEATYSSKAWAVGGTGVTDTAARGAAKEWATDVEFTFAYTDITVGTETITKIAHGLVTDTKVKIWSTGNMPLVGSNRLNPTTVFFFERIDDNSFKLHTQAVSGTTYLLNLLDQGSGTFTLATQVDAASGEWSSKYYAGAAEANAVKAENVDANTLDVSNFHADTLVVLSETIASNNNDTTIPTSAAVKQYADAAGFPSGTKMLFHQTAAPTGWTKLSVTGSGDTNFNDVGLRVVTGTITDGLGGSVAFDTAFASVTPTISMSNAEVTLSIAQMPSHGHNMCVYTGSGGAATSITGGGSSPGCAGYSQPSNATGGDDAHTHSNTASSSAINLDVKYVDMIIASKD